MRPTFSPLSATVSLHVTKLAAIVFTTALLAFPASAQTSVQSLLARPDLQTQSQSQPVVDSQQWPRLQSPELIALRSSSSPAEKKLSYNLLLLSRLARHAPLGSLASSVDNTLVAHDGTVTVDVIAYLSPSLMASPVMEDILRANGAISEPAYQSDHLRIHVSQRQLLDLAANPNVFAIHDANAPVATSMASLQMPARAGN